MNFRTLIAGTVLASACCLISQGTLAVAHADGGATSLLSQSVASQPTGGVTLVVFGGGTTAEMTQAVSCNGAAPEMIWTTRSDGSFIGYNPGASDFDVNIEWTNTFGNQVPAGTPLVVTC